MVPGPRRHPGRARAFTLVELLFATAVLTGVAYGIYHLFRATNRQASQAAFISAAQKEARSGLKRIHDELSKAAYWTELTPARVYYLQPGGSRAADDSQDLATQRANEEACRRLYWITHDQAPSLDVTYDVSRPPDTSPKLLLSWYQCAPKRTGLGGAASPDDPVEGFLALCQVILVGDVVVFQRSTEQGADQFAKPVTVELMHDVEQVTVGLAAKDADAEVLEGCQVTMGVTLHHPNWGVFPNTRISQQISARAPVGAEGLPPP